MAINKTFVVAFQDAQNKPFFYQYTYTDDTLNSSGEAKWTDVIFDACTFDSFNEAQTARMSLESLTSKHNLVVVSYDSIADQIIEKMNQVFDEIVKI